MLDWEERGDHTDLFDGVQIPAPNSSPIQASRLTAPVLVRRRRCCVDHTGSGS